jgi:hypothetical protein
VLATLAILLDDSKELHRSARNKESRAIWQEQSRSMIQRGIPQPFTVSSDGEPDAIATVEPNCPAAERIRCWLHKTG